MSPLPLDYAVVIIPTLPLFLVSLLILLIAIMLYSYFFLALLPNHKEWERLFEKEQAEAEQENIHTQKTEEHREDNHPPQPATSSGLVEVEIVKPIRECYKYAR